jgi:hypothetical protein
MYCRATDHDTEDCTTLLGKIQEKQNQNNQNVQWISTEAREDGRNINIVMRGGAKTGDDVAKQEPVQHQWIKKNTEPPKRFDAEKEKETFKEARQEFLKKNVASTSTMQHTQDVPMYEMSSALDHTSEVHPGNQVSCIKTFLQSCIQLFKDPSSVIVLQNLLDRCTTNSEGKLEQRIVNHLHARRRTNREFRLNANIRRF